MSAREVAAPFADARVESAGQPLDELEGVCRIRRLLYAGFVVSCVARGDVFPHGLVEQDGVLCDDADLVAQAGEGGLSDVDAVDSNAAGGDVVEAGDELYHGALACAGEPDQGDHFTAAHLEVEVVQHLLLAIVGERDPLEAKALRHGRDVDCGRRLDDAAGMVNKLEDPLRTGDAGLYVVVDRRQLAHRVQHHGKGEVELQKVCGVEGAGDDLAPAHEHKDDKAEHEDYLGDRGSGGVRLNRLHEKTP